MYIYTFVNVHIQKTYTNNRKTYTNTNSFLHNGVLCCAQSHSVSTLCDPMDCRPDTAPLSMGFSRQEYWNGLPFSSSGDLANSGMEPTSPVSPALAGRFFTTGHPQVKSEVLLPD